MNQKDVKELVRKRDGYICNDFGGNGAVRELTDMIRNSNKKALEAYKKCIDTNPNFSLAQYEIGKIYQLILDDENAIKYYKSARRNTSFDDLNYRLGMLYYKNESFLKAMDPIKDYIIN